MDIGAMIRRIRGGAGNMGCTWGCGKGGRHRKQLIFSVADIIAAALAGPNIPLIGQKIICMLDRDHAGAGFCGQKSFGRKLHVVGADAARDIVTDLMIKLQVGGLLQPGIYVVLGHGDLLVS